MVSPSLGISPEDCVPKKTNYIMLDESELPDEQTLIDYFEAMTIDFSNRTTGIDLPTARELTKNILRKQRITLFEKNDLRLRDSIISNDQQELDLAITERDRLRNITLLADVAPTFDDLKRLRLV